MYLDLSAMLQQVITIMDSSRGWLPTCEDGNGEQNHNDRDNRGDDDGCVAGTGRLRNRPAGSKNSSKKHVPVEKELSGDLYSKAPKSQSQCPC